MTTDAAYLLARRIVDGCWIAFTVFWIANSFHTKRSVYREGAGQRALVTLVIAAAFVMVVSARALHPIDISFVPRAAATAAIAAALCVAGLLFAIWARVTIGTNWSGLVTLKENHELVLRGPYAIVRHPIYTGILTMAFGTSLLSGRIAAMGGWLLLFLALWFKASQEEALMLRQFPQEYASYRKRVKRVLPFVL